VTFKEGGKINYVVTKKTGKKYTMSVKEGTYISQRGENY